MTAHSYVMANKDNESHGYLDEMLSDYRAALLDIEATDEERKSDALKKDILEAGRQHGIFWFDVAERSRKLVSIIDTDHDDEVPA